MQDTAVTKEEQLGKIVGMFAGFFGTWVMNIGRRAGLFAAIDEAGSVTAEALARKLDYEPRYVETWCRGAYAFDLLEYDAAKGFRLAPLVKDILLDATQPTFMGGRAEFFPLLVKDFQIYPHRMRDKGLYPWTDHEAPLFEALKKATRADFPNMTSNVLPKAPELLARLQAGGKILDVGCGVGVGMVHCAKTFPNAQVRGIDIDERAIEEAREAIRQEGLAPRVKAEVLNAHDLVATNAYDLVVFNVSLHEMDAGHEGRVTVLRRCRAALRDGGSILVSDVPLPDRIEDFKGTTYQMFVGVTFYVSLFGYTLLSDALVRKLLADAGYRNIRRMDQPTPTRMMFLAEK